jgi:effector-binding domain-containing protein
MTGSFEIRFDGERSWKRLDYGPLGVATNAFDGALFWDLHPVSGARLFQGAERAALLRLNGIVRGESWRKLYDFAEMAGEERRDGRPFPVLSLWPPDTAPDTWVLDAETHLPARIEIVLPSLEGESRFTIEYSDWRPVAGVLFPRQERVKAEGAVGTFVYESIEHGVAVDPLCFDPPEEVRRLATDIPRLSELALQVVEREAQPIASIRVEAPADALPRTLAQLLPEVMSCLSEAGATAVGPPFARIHSEKDGRVDLEAGLPVASAIEPSGRVRPSTLPGGRAAILWHTGPYSGLAEKRARLAAAMAERELVARGGPWQIYWTDPTLDRDPKRRRTQLVWPVE